MSKSIQLLDSTYWDTKGIAHNKENLYTIINNLSTGVVVDLYESSSGRYVKYSNGLMIQTKRVYVEIAFNEWHDGVAWADFDMGNWLTPFKSSNMIVLIGDSLHMSGNNQAWSCQSPNDITSTYAGTFRALRVFDSGGQPSNKWPSYLYRTCIGFWK